MNGSVAAFYPSGIHNCKSAWNQCTMVFAFSFFIAQILFILIIRLPLVFKMISAVVPVVLCRYVSLQLLPAWEENMTERMYKLVSFPTLAVK